ARAALGVAAWVAVTLVLLARVQDAALGAPFAGRALVTAAWILPLGVVLGFPFAAALRELAEDAPALVPWAWGVNACAAVVAATTTVLFAMGWGFRATLVLAAALYGLAFLLRVRPAPDLR